MHVLAAAIYADYKQASTPNPHSYTEWFEHAVQDGQLRGSNLQKTIQTFFSPTHCH